MFLRQSHIFVGFTVFLSTTMQSSISEVRVSVKRDHNIFFLKIRKYSCLLCFSARYKDSIRDFMYGQFLIAGMVNITYSPKCT